MRLRLAAAAGVAALATVLAVGTPAGRRSPTRCGSTSPCRSARRRLRTTRDEFQTTGPAAGWGYLYNANGALGNPANYAPLTLNGGQYTAPERHPRGGAHQASTDPVAYPPVPPLPETFPATFVRPGLGSLEDPAGIEWAAVIAYTIQASDLAAAGVTGPANVAITAYDFAVSTKATPDGMSARIYAGTNPTPLIEFSDDTDPPFFFPPGFRFETTLDPRPIPLGTFNVGDTIYIALGANNISVVPEPTTLALLAPAGLLLVAPAEVRLSYALKPEAPAAGAPLVAPAGQPLLALVLVAHLGGEVLAKPGLLDGFVNVVDVLLHVAVREALGVAVEESEVAVEPAVSRRIVDVRLGVGVERAVAIVEQHHGRRRLPARVDLAHPQSADISGGPFAQLVLLGDDGVDLGEPLLAGKVVVVRQESVR